MDSTNGKKYLKRMLILIMGVYVIYSLNVQIKYNSYVNTTVNTNYDRLSIITNNGDALANRLEEFVKLTSEKEENNELNSALYDNWRLVDGASRSIQSYALTISTKHPREESYEWKIIQYSLLRVDQFIEGKTHKFLENHSYAISSEEKEKMEAVITVFRAFSEEKNNEFGDLNNIVEAIKEPMSLIDENYLGITEEMARIKDKD
ncbi:hypothetical protein FZW96_08000 [Bacillus sp. BGMRC 2118]|nr:hypothetical protein FZW96_08000 [Bacillus sp. BGMRC 2118]